MKTVDEIVEYIKRKINVDEEILKLKLSAANATATRAARIRSKDILDFINGIK